MKKIIIKMSQDKTSLFIKASNAIVNKTAIINIKSSPFINFVIEKDNNKNILSLQTDSSLIELMEFNTIEEAVETKQYIEKRLYKKNHFNNTYCFMKKLMIILLSLFIITGIPAYTYFKIQQISKINSIINNKAIDSDNSESHYFDNMQKRLTQLTSQPNLTPEENKELDQIQNKLDNVNKNQNSGSDELSKIQNRLIELSKKPKDSLTDEEKKEILDMRNQLINLDKNKVIQNNEAPSPNNEEIVKMKQQHMDNMLDEIKKKSF